MLANKAQPIVGFRHAVTKHCIFRLPQRGPFCTNASAGDNVDLDALLSKYAPGASSSGAGNSVSKPQPAAQPSGSSKPSEKNINIVVELTPASLLHCNAGLGALLAVNWGVYASAVYFGKATQVAKLVLGASGGPFWQYLSSAFVHSSWPHLARDLGIIWLAGRLLHKELGSAGIWFTYCMAAVGANISALWLMPAKVKALGGMLGIAATGGTTGLALVALLLAARPTLGYCVSAVFFWQLLLGPILATPVPGSVVASRPAADLFSALVSGGGMPALLKGAKSILTTAVADPGLTWFWGAAAAALIVVALARFPDSESH